LKLERQLVYTPLDLGARELLRQYELDPASALYIPASSRRSSATAGIESWRFVKKIAKETIPSPGAHR
jgi:hypothetical protein